MKRRWLVLTAVAIAFTSSCSSTAPDEAIVRAVDRAAGTRCVDAELPNSTPEEMADAQLSSPTRRTALDKPFTNPITGEEKNSREVATEILGQQKGAESLGALRATMIEYAFTDVPDGGDARFAEAVCDLQNAWGTLQFDPESFGYVEKTPHLLHAAGREICSSLVGMDPAEIAYKNLDDRVNRAETNAAQLRQDDITSLRLRLDELQKNGVPADATLLIDLIASMEEELERLRATSDDEHADAVRATADVRWAAVEHQCPQFSAVGFGSVCATIDIPENPGDGVARVHTGEVDCGTTERVFDDYFSFNQSTDSMMESWTCWDSAETIDSPVLVTCAEDEGSGQVVLTPD